MQFHLTNTPALNQSDCLVIGLLKDTSWPEILNEINRQHAGLIERLVAKLHTAGDSVWQTDINGHALLLICCGTTEQYKLHSLNQQIAHIMQTVLKHKIQSLTLILPQIANYTPDWHVQQMVLKLSYHVYQFLDFKTQKKEPYALENITIYQPGTSANALKHAEAIAAGVTFTRQLANLPANVCTPHYIADQAKQLDKQFSTIQTKILDQNTLHKMGMHALLAVGQGSQQPSCLVELHYQGSDKHAAPVILVGKGITFDSGGISIKPGHGMEEMKFDMAGAASVLGVIKACALMQLPINVIGLLACAENMPSGSAVKPGDVVTGLSGQTIEIVNTDAEGRLVLSDTLTYAERFKPRFVIDIATLTGAVIVALGHVMSGLMTEDDELAELILSAARDSDDKAWRLPIDEGYQESINSPVADIMNSTADRVAGSITAACFLSRFTKQYRWAHLDIAGTAWVSGSKRVATGRPVPLLIEFLQQLAYAH